jgi:hypothetical protein
MHKLSVAKRGIVAQKGMRRVVHRNGVVEFVGPGTGEHMVVMEGLTVETNDSDALAIVSVAATITCGACFKRWLLPVVEYKNGWSECRHCKTRLFLPPVYLPNRQGKIQKPSGG